MYIYSYKQNCTYQLYCLFICCKMLVRTLTFVRLIFLKINKNQSEIEINHKMFTLFLSSSKKKGKK